MNYELAKELKDAGFPHIHFYCKAEHMCQQHLPDCEFIKLSVPTLEELIEAIPIPDPQVGFLTISHIHGLWYAGYEKYEIFNPEATGSTPLIAVARLWLALTPKTQV